jgi:flagellar basal body-associated protein FliL
MRGIDKAIVVIAGIVVMMTAAAAIWIAYSLKTDADGNPGSTTPSRSPALVNTGDGANLDNLFQFTGIGRLRIPLKIETERTQENQKNGTGPTMIVNVVFPYNAADTPFTEELAKTIPFFRKAITGLFGSLTASDPRLHDETALKTQLLDTFNNRLHLGAIDHLYFSEFIMLD